MTAHTSQTRLPTRLALLIAGLLAGLGTFSTPNEAHADIFKFWAAARGAYFSGTGDVFTGFEAPFGGGLETGVELLGITAFAEGLALGGDQFLITGNLGFDFTFGDDARFHLGAFTGPILFIFPEPESVDTVDFSVLDQDEQDALKTAAGVDDLGEIEAEFEQYAEDEKDLARTAFGWNLARLRLALDFKLIPGFYIGAAGQVGYHYLITGEEVAAGAKNEAVNRFADENGIKDESLLEPIREVVGAEEVDEDNLNGVNWDAMIYFRFELGT